jgi:TolA-binding protein
LPETLTLPATDERIIKTLSLQKKTKAVLSLYFRYPPQKVTTKSNKETAIVTFDIILGNPPAAPTEIPSKLQGGDAANKTKAAFPNPITISNYAKNWIAFFTEYESQVKIAVSPKFFLPPFPLAAAIQPNVGKEIFLLPEIVGLIQENKWSEVCQQLRKQLMNQSDEKIKEQLVLAFAEALVRSGEYKEPHVLLQKITLQYPDTLMASLAQFLLIYQQSVKGDHVVAYYELAGLLKKIEHQTPFTPSFNLLLAELALMAGRSKDAEQLLIRDDIIRNEQLKSIRLLRQADLLYAKDEKAKALTAYLELTKQSSLVDSDPMSLAHFCDTLYSNKRFQEAAKKYRQLSDLLNKEPQHDLVLFRLAMSQYHSNPTSEINTGVELRQIQDNFPGTEGAARALLKQTDLEYIAKRMSVEKAEDAYGKMAEKGDTILIREEASFKQALVSALSGDHQTSVAQLMAMLRGFRSGKLHIEAQALLIEQLPGVIKKLANDKEYVKAMVIAKQNRIFFSRGWLDTSLLIDLAAIYSKLGLTDQTAQIYQYIFEFSGEADKEKMFLPLIQGFSAADQYAQVEEYADRYLLSYPKGTDLPAIFLLKIKALYESGQLDKAITLLNTNTRPHNPQLEFLKARIFFDLQQWQSAIDILTKPELQGLVAKNNGSLLLAEAYFQTGQDNLAAQAFRRIVEQGGAVEQAQYRLAQIELKKNNTSQALNLFKKIAEKGKDPHWTKLAREEAAILRLKQKQ